MARKKGKKTVDTARSKTYKTGNIFAVRGTPDYLEWVKRLAEHCRAGGLPSLVDDALIGHAKRHGFKEAPPARLEPRDDA